MNDAPLWYWMQERHEIYKKKEAGLSKPWTKDHILRSYRFCNVFRELDTETIWLRKNWREPFADDDNLWFAMAVARQINWHPTLAEIGYPIFWDPRKTYENMSKRWNRDEKVYTSAYIITATFGANKIHGTVYSVLDPLYEQREKYRPRPTDNLQSFCERLQEAQGFGPFMAYEVTTDLRHTRYLRHANDKMTWANPGPGAKRGLNRIFNRPLKFKQKPHKFIEEMRILLDRSETALPNDFPMLELRDIEHALCETDKYLRVKNGEGRPRSKYDGE